jgi:hypothetical protein
VNCRPQESDFSDTLKFNLKEHSRNREFHEICTQELILSSYNSRVEIFNSSEEEKKQSSRTTD